MPQWIAKHSLWRAATIRKRNVEIKRKNAGRIRINQYQVGDGFSFSELTCAVPQKNSLISNVSPEFVTLKHLIKSAVKILPHPALSSGIR